MTQGSPPDTSLPRSPPPPPPPPAPQPTRWRRADAVALVAVVALAALVRLPRLSDPSSLVFDETYYAKDACTYVYGPAGVCGVDAEQTQVHPPLGKWLIAAGIRVFGYDSLGWRAGAALAGLVTVALLYLLARRLLGSVSGAAIASGLLAFDFLHFVQSRVAMLDVFATTFTVAAALFVHLDRDARPSGGAARRILWRPWRLAAGAAAGAALASKWSGLLTVAMVVVVATAWEWQAARRKRGGAARAFLAEGAPSLAIALGALPLAVYALSYAARLEGALLAAPFGAGSWLRALWDRQLYMLDFHRGLTDTHPYTSPPWSWPLIKRPVSYFFETGSAGDYLEIMAVGNPLVWWPSLVALGFVALRWRRTGGAGGAEALVLAGFAFNYFPWLLLAGDRSAVFLFYLLPAVPFMCLALAYAVVHLGWSGRAKPAVALAGAAVVASFLFYYPVLAKVPIEQGEWLRRIWVFDDCDRPAAPARPVPSREGLESADAPPEPEHVEPEGWCWI